MLQYMPNIGSIFAYFEGAGPRHSNILAGPDMPVAPSGLAGAPLVAFSDGACSANGRAGAAAHWGACVFDSVPGAMLDATPGATPGTLLDCVSDLRFSLLAGPVPGRQTNVRAELAALCGALRALLCFPPTPGATVVSDSLISIRAIEPGGWLETRRCRLTCHEMKNLDLIEVAYDLLGRASRLHGPVSLVHVRGHQKRPAAAAGPWALLLWAGNQLADRLATGGQTFVRGRAGLAPGVAEASCRIPLADIAGSGPAAAPTSAPAAAPAAVSDDDLQQLLAELGLQPADE